MIKRKAGLMLAGIFLALVFLVSGCDFSFLGAGGGVVAASGQGNGALVLFKMPSP